MPPQERRKIPGAEMGCFVHESSIVDPDVAIGEGTKIWHFCHILSGSEIGSRCVIGQNVMIGPDVKVGSGCKIQNNVSIYKGVELGDDVFCGPAMVFTNVLNPRAFIERKHEFKKTLVGKGATIGANATVICGVRIGAYAFIGAGAVVAKDVPAYGLVVGIPAVMKGYVCSCAGRLEGLEETKRASCPLCGRAYELTTGGASPINK